MASITIRNLEDDLKRRLRIRAAEHGRSMEEEARGVPYAVASNGEHAKMRVTLGATGLWERFEGRRFSATEVPRPKPAPDLFLHAARTMGFPPERTIVVEDSTLGVEGATAAGMAVIGYAELVAPERLRAAGAVATVHALSEVEGLLGAR